MYKVKEIYYSIQGEGFHTGRPAVFCRFSGCNLWNGLEKDRHKAICKFCDTDFWGTDGLNGGKYSASELAQKCVDLWPDPKQKPFVVCTGGEPLLQIDETLVNELHKQNFYIAIETNGTIEAVKNIDWICMSPKAGTKILIKAGDELKLVFPQQNLAPSQFENYTFDHFYIQPMDSPKIKLNTTAAIQYCQENPQWKLSLQTQKLIGIR